MLDWTDVINHAGGDNPEPDCVDQRSEADWQQLLPDDVYQVTRNKGTEAAFSSPMCSIFEPGKYACACCNSELFDASEKFDSRSGWPSFTQPVKNNSVAYHHDGSHGMNRIEALCNSCKAHLGHVFPDGPEPSGLRYCINALSLKKL